MHSNIDCAIASVIERGQELTIPTVFAAYLQRIIAYSAPDGVSQADTDAIARAALVSFERAMDKYPMPSRPTTAKTRPRSKAPPESTKIIATPKTAWPGAVGIKMYPAEVAQLRWDYQQAILRDTTDPEDRGCTCMSCGCLLSLREQAALLASESEDAGVSVPVRRRRARKMKQPAMKKNQSTHAVPFDPYAPSTSAAAV